MWISHAPIGFAQTQKTYGSVSQSINRQQYTRAQFVTICFMPLWISSRSAVQHTCSYILQHMMMSHALWAPRLLRPVSVLSLERLGVEMMTSFCFVCWLVQCIHCTFIPVTAHINSPPFTCAHAHTCIRFSRGTQSSYLFSPCLPW